MHINDVYALRGVLRDVAAGRAVSSRMVEALLEAADDEVEQFEQYIEQRAADEELAN